MGLGGVYETRGDSRHLQPFVATSAAKRGLLDWTMDASSSRFFADTIDEQCILVGAAIGRRLRNHGILSVKK